jgi:hypothetical protein
LAAAELAAGAIQYEGVKKSASVMLSAAKHLHFP